MSSKRKLMPPCPVWLNWLSVIPRTRTVTGWSTYPGGGFDLWLDRTGEGNQLMFLYSLHPSLPPCSLSKSNKKNVLRKGLNNFFLKEKANAIEVFFNLGTAGCCNKYCSQIPRIYVEDS